MTAQALSLPVDIPWQRFAYSRDMMDISFDDPSLPPKWRSSMAVYAYVVPEEQTADAYPESRIIYLRLSCSITGFNAGESLVDPEVFAEEGDVLDDLQSSAWEAVQSSGWANRYWPCQGAIVQLAVYPKDTDGVSIDDYPYITDFEPKKRELYETRSESGEYLSGSSDKLSVQKGGTTTDSTEKSNILTGAKAGGFGVSAEVSGEWGTRKDTEVATINTETNDSSREKRESSSFTSSFSQMYQLFNGYHLGMNRALFVVAPRPHTVSSPAQVEFNLVNGQRKLEGIQEMFLVVRMPRTTTGVCIQANLDTGHVVTTRNGVMLMMAKDNTLDPGTGAGPGGGGVGPVWPDFDLIDPSTEVAPDTWSTRLVVTRRSVRNCAEFGDEGLIFMRPAGDADPDPDGEAMVASEGPVPFVRQDAEMLRTADVAAQRVYVANLRNRFQARLSETMLSSFSAPHRKLRPFSHTTTFAELVQLALAESRDPVDEVAGDAILSAEHRKTLHERRITTISDLFHQDAARGDRELETIRKRILAHVLKPAVTRY